MNENNKIRAIIEKLDWRLGATMDCARASYLTLLWLGFLSFKFQVSVIQIGVGW